MSCGPQKLHYKCTSRYALATRLLWATMPFVKFVVFPGAVLHSVCVSSPVLLRRSSKVGTFTTCCSSASHVLFPTGSEDDLLFQVQVLRKGHLFLWCLVQNECSAKHGRCTGLPRKNGNASASLGVARVALARLGSCFWASADQSVFLFLL